MRTAARTDANQSEIMEISDKKLTAALANLEKAKAARALKPSTLITKTCPVCGSGFQVKPSHVVLETYCSRLCMAKGYKTRLKGASNPNFRSAAGKFCQQCGATFQSYIKTRRFCSFACYTASIPNLIKRLGRTGVDSNQKQIVEALRALGVSVYIASHIGDGFPDLVVGYNGQTKLIEVKNPENAYGRSGFNQNQKKWNENWQGELPVIVTNVREALAAVGAQMQ